MWTGYVTGNLMRKTRDNTCDDKLATPESLAPDKRPHGCVISRCNYHGVVCRLITSVYKVMTGRISSLRPNRPRVLT